MMNIVDRKKKAAELVVFMKQNDPVWKPGSDQHHLNRRMRKGHLPGDFTLDNYNSLIQKLCTSDENEAYVYHLKGFDQDYYVFGDGCNWIAIIGENGVMETAFPPDSYSSYLALEARYQLLSTIKEVLRYVQET